MDDELKTFVLLKYEILTSDSDTWKRCEAKYPASVKQKWAWRCVDDIEHLAKGHPEAEECIRISKLCRDGKATMEELDKAWDDVPWSPATAYHATTTAVAAATYHAANPYAFATYYAAAEREEKWAMYIEWLIEELCEYESTKEK